MASAPPEAIPADEFQIDRDAQVQEVNLLIDVQADYTTRLVTEEDGKEIEKALLAVLMAPGSDVVMADVVLQPSQHEAWMEFMWANAHDITGKRFTMTFPGLVAKPREGDHVEKFLQKHLLKKAENFTFLAPMMGGLCLDPDQDCRKGRLFHKLYFWVPGRLVWTDRPGKAAKSTWDQQAQECDRAFRTRKRFLPASRPMGFCLWAGFTMRQRLRRCRRPQAF
jgi:hypothetical protein